MNWITKFIKPKITSLFEKKSSKIEENLWTTCGCKNLIYKEDLESNQKVCPKVRGSPQTYMQRKI